MNSSHNDANTTVQYSNTYSAYQGRSLRRRWPSNKPSIHL